MYDKDCNGVMNYKVGTESLLDELDTENLTPEAEEIDIQIFHYVPDEILESRDADKIVDEIVDVSGLALKDYKQEEENEKEINKEGTL